MRVLDLFAGIGGFSLGLERAGFYTAAFCEANNWRRRNALQRNWPDVPIWKDIRDVTSRSLRAAGIDRVDVVTGGFPCQPFSLPGDRRGTDDDRHLWPEMARIIGELRPAWVLGENVVGLVRVALDGVLSDLENMGYAARPFVIPAASIDAPHQRDRVWIVANRNGAGSPFPQFLGESAAPQRGVQTGPAAPELRCAHPWDRAEQIIGADGKLRRAEPGVRLLAHGVPERVARVSAFGDAVVPQIPEVLGRAILEAEAADG